MFDLFFAFLLLVYLGLCNNCTYIKVESKGYFDGCTAIFILNNYDCKN